ncbi:MAG: glutathione S-transferase family protein [Myxococcota bacterium]
MSILVHHLRIGRSIFTVWLLEELGVAYDLKIYVRNAHGRAPPELKDAHPLGKSPVIEIDGFTLAESGAIALYLAETRDPNGRFTPPPSGPARGRWLQWLHYPEASAYTPLLISLLLKREQEPKPGLVSMFAAGEVALQLDHIDAQLGDDAFILGDSMTLPDFGMTYMLSFAERLGLLRDYPRLRSYVERNMARSAFQRALARTGG